MQARELVEKYLSAFASGGDRDLVALELLLAPNVVVKSPLGSFSSSRVYLDDVARDRLMIDGLTVEQILTEGDQVSVRYRLRSRDPSVREVLVSEWFTVREGKIVNLTSSFDATAIHNSMMQI